MVARLYLRQPISYKLTQLLRPGLVFLDGRYNFLAH